MVLNLSRGETKNIDDYISPISHIIFCYCRCVHSLSIMLDHNSVNFQYPLIIATCDHTVYSVAHYSTKDQISDVHKFRGVSQLEREVHLSSIRAYVGKGEGPEGEGSKGGVGKWGESWNIPTACLY